MNARESDLPPPHATLAEAHQVLTAPGEFFEMETREINGVEVRTWKNAPSSLREAFLVGRSHGAKTFLVHEDERVSFEAFGRAVAALADEFVRRGVQKGDRVAIAMRNLPEWAVAFYAAAVVGAIATPLNAWWTGDELGYALADSAAKILVADEERWLRIRQAGASPATLHSVYVTRAEPSEDLAFAVQLETVIGPSGAWSTLADVPLPEVTLSPEDPATILYTSGTTGRPKGALGSHRNILTTVVTGAFIAARTALREGEALAPPAPDAPQRALLLAVPLFHVIGCHATLAPALYGGAKLVMMRKWDPESALRLIEAERITDAGGVPTMALQLLEHPTREQYDLSSLASLSYGGAPSGQDLVSDIRRRLPSARPVTGWGMTESSGGVFAQMGLDCVRRPASCGAPIPICDVKIVDPDGVELEPGLVGELLVRGPNVVQGYWKQPAATAETFQHGWLRSGDLARRDAEGFLFIVDRLKDVIIRGGENIYSVEVENVLQEHRAVAEAALVAIPHPLLGEEPAAVVHLRVGVSATPEELRLFVAERLAAFKVPVRIEISSDPLPRNSVGKIVKPQLRAFFRIGGDDERAR